MDFNEIKQLLITPILGSGKSSESSIKRLTNIGFIENLNRNTLEHKVLERRLLVHKTKEDELICIQYPGKESKNNIDNNRPWDFRPVVFLSNGKRFENDMSFKNIWDTIYEKSLEVPKDVKEEVLTVLSLMFYRLAYMIDNIPINLFNTQYNDLSIINGQIDRVSEPVPLEIPLLYKYSPDVKILDYLYSHCPSSWGGLSIEGFLYYNELLIWNEDCKYYYRNKISEDKKAWIGDTGRVNTALTHMMIISFLLGKIPLSRLCDGFNRGRGVAPMQKREVIESYSEFFILQDRLI
jgi:hypothetical protein